MTVIQPRADIVQLTTWTQKPKGTLEGGVNYLGSR